MFIDFYRFHATSIKSARCIVTRLLSNFPNKLHTSHFDAFGSFSIHVAINDSLSPSSDDHIRPIIPSIKGARTRGEEKLSRPDRRKFKSPVRKNTSVADRSFVARVKFAG